jgi:autoinducer 2 (AI-2) kinase
VSWLLGLDLGGGSARALALNAATGEQRVVAKPWPAPLGAEIELEAAFAALAAASLEVVAGCGAGARFAGVACTAMRFGGALLGADGRALLGVSNRDARGLGKALALAAQQGPALQARTGHWPIPVLPLARCAALQEGAPELWARVAQVLALSDWLAFRLCGEIASDLSQAGASGMLDLASGRWALDLAEPLGVRAAQLPQLVAAGTRLGLLGPEAAAALGLDPGAVVAAGGADTQCALLGLGVTEPGATGAVCGTTLPLQRVIAPGTSDSAGRTWRAPHVVPGLWVAESNAGPAGEALEWLGRALFPEARSGAARALAEAALAEPGAAGVLSTFGAQLPDARALALPLGDLTLTHLLGAPERGRARLLRAVAEGIAYAVRANLEALAAVAPGAGTLALGGGASRSDLFAQIVADVTDGAVERGVAEASALGAAICAGVGAGVFGTARDGARVLARREGFVPDAARARAYAASYARWRELRAKRAPADGVAQGHAIQGMFGALAQSGAGTHATWRPRILITAEVDASALDALHAIGETEYASYRAKGRLLQGDALTLALRGFDVLVTEIDLVSAAVLLASPQLRVVAACRGDAVNVDVAAASALGVPVLHAPGRNADAVADLTIAFLLALARKLPAANEFLRDSAIEAGDLGAMGRAYGTLRGRELWGKTIGLVGLGAVGRKVAERLAGFGARVLAADPVVTQDSALRANAELAPLARVLAESDFISLHAPVTDATRGLIGAAQLAQMKVGACLVNTARAALVDEGALAAALASGRLAGAALDVFSVEPPGADHALLGLPNVIATPHVGGNTFEVAIHQGQIVSDDLARLVRGERPRHLADASVWERTNLAAPRDAPSEAVRAELLARPEPAVTDLQRDKRPPAAKQLAPAAQRATSAAPSAGAGGEVVARLRGALERFAASVASDAALQAAAAGRDVALQFWLPDAALRFFLALRGGRASAALGDADPAPEVNLRMRAAIFDGMLTGRVNAMQEAMSGGIAFSGDAGKAMTLQQVQPELQRLWAAAREQAGDLSGLAALATAGTTAQASPVEASDPRTNMVRVIEELYRQSLITATGGNVSARIAGADELWITPSALFKGDLRAEAMVRIGVDGRVRDENAASPSSERLMHCAVYAAKPEAQAVIHAHAPHATILANAGLPFLPISTEAAFFGELPRIPFIMPGSEALAAAVREAMRASWAVLLVNHGLLVAGRSLRRAADMAEIIERSAEVILGCYAVGKPPPVLPESAVADLRKLGELVA